MDVLQDNLSWAVLTWPGLVVAGWFKRFPALVGELRGVASLRVWGEKVTEEEERRTMNWDVVIAQTRAAICSWAGAVSGWSRLVVGWVGAKQDDKLSKLKSSSKLGRGRTVMHCTVQYCTVRILWLPRKVKLQ
ncbi:hypothetical protein FPOA_08725 [Fusarium poae]|jgi:hypothetical protein|uniref:Uncharacterized protein n=1 Tax=Fusarium poae TaxID=36050 RepID=A0A1B8API1_FUSPO|nr:hypothetical protein FPOA_08725 [Fusarium poae]